MVLVAVAVLMQAGEHLVDGGGCGQHDAVRPRRGQRDPEVLVVKVDLEAGGEVVLEEVGAGPP